MYAGTYLVTQGTEVCVLRIDVQNSGLATYSLTDDRGTTTSWTRDLECQNQRLVELANEACNAYVAMIESGGWTGTFECIAPPAGTTNKIAPEPIAPAVEYSAVLH